MSDLCPHLKRFTVLYDEKVGRCANCGKIVKEKELERVGGCEEETKKE